MAVCPHPDLEQLRAFSLGRLDDESASVSIAAHLDTCSDCLRALETVSGDRLEKLVRATDSNDTAATGCDPSPDGAESLDAFLAPPQGPDEIGRLGQYRVLRVLGSGGMGLVFVAEDVKLKRRVALKVMKPEIARKDQHRNRFLREAQIAAAVEHDNICPIYQVGEENHVPFIAMPFLKGEPLDVKLKREQTLSSADAIRIGRQIALGLDAAHQAGLIHRDIKPANVWLEAPSGRVKILDFGLGRAVAEDVQLTASGAILGTPAYMAPEQARGMGVDHRADLWSLGVLLYEMTTGRRPFVGANTMAVLSSLALDTPAAPQVVNIAVPTALSGLIARLLAKDPTKRPASAQEVADALAALEQPAPRSNMEMNSGADATVEVLPEKLGAPAIVPSSGNTRSRRGLLVAAALLLTLVPLGYLFGGTIIRFATNQGELVVEVDDKNVEVTIAQNGIVVHDKTRQREFTLSAGKGEIEVMEKDGIKLTTKKFELTRGGKITIRVTLNELADARRPKGDPKAEPVPLGGDPDRRAAEFALSVGGKVFVNEVDRQISALPDLPKEPFRLTALDVSNTKVTDSGMIHFKDCKNLTSLSVSYTDVTDAGLVHFKDCKNLTSLVLGPKGLTDAGLAYFKDCKNLKSFNVNYASLVTDAGLAHFKDCKNLISLGLAGTQVTDAGLAYFKDCKDMADLGLSYTQVTGAGLVHFKDCKELWRLGLYGSKLTDAGLVHLKDCKKLTEFNIDGTQVSDAGLAHLNKEIVAISMADTRVTDAGLAHLKDFKNLAGLTVTNTRVTDAGLAHLKDCKELFTLEMAFTKVTDAGIAHLKDCKKLARLNFGFMPLTDASLEVIVGWPRLQSMNVVGGRISLAGFEQLKAALPSCTIEWSERNRSAVEQVLAVGGLVEIGTPGKDDTRAVKKGEPLPKSFFQVRRIVLKNIKGSLGEHLTGTLVALSFAEIDRLDDLDISGTPQAVHGQFATLPKLKRLLLDDQNIDGPAVEQLAKQSELVELSLRGVGLTDDNLNRLPKLPKLRRLVLDNNPLLGSGLPALQDQTELIDLSLACPTITDLTAKYLTSLKQLQRLSLAGASVGDLGLVHIEGLTKLATLDLSKTKVTSAGIERLRKALPACKITWDGAAQTK